MRPNLQLSESPTLHYSIAKIIQKLLHPIIEIEFTKVMSQFSHTKLTLFSVDDYVLSLEIEFDKNICLVLGIVGKAICNSNKFELVISRENKEKNYGVLSLDFIHHKLEFLINEISGSKKMEYVSAEVVDYLHDLEFKIPKKAQQAWVISNVTQFILWARKCNIPEDIFPYSEKKLLSLKALNLSSCNLESIPESIISLKNLEELYLSNNNLSAIPFEIFTLKNLKKLNIQNNFLNYVPNEINNLHNLEEIILSGNNIQKLLKITDLRQLKQIKLDNNRLKNEDILIFRESIGDDVQLSYKNQKDILPFYIEKLSINTLNEAEILRDKIFSQIDKKEQKILQASINKETLSYVLKENEIKDIQYWVAKDKKNSQIIAMTGLYTELEDDEDSCWLGWFCLDKKYRRKGFGKELLNFSIEQAKSLSKRYLHLYTYNSKEYQVAINMYKSYGFKEYNVKNTKYKRDMYFKINIEEKND